MDKAHNAAVSLTSMLAKFSDVKIVKLHCRAEWRRALPKG
jgi:hypothetical protein